MGHNGMGHNGTGHNGTGHNRITTEERRPTIERLAADVPFNLWNSGETVPGRG
jgi:hypothetical protein